MSWKDEVDRISSERDEKDRVLDAARSEMVKAEGKFRNELKEWIESAATRLRDSDVRTRSVHSRFVDPVKGHAAVRPSLFRRVPAVREVAPAVVDQFATGWRIYAYRSDERAISPPSLDAHYGHVRQHGEDHYEWSFKCSPALFVPRSGRAFVAVAIHNFKSGAERFDELLRDWPSAAPRTYRNLPQRQAIAMYSSIGKFADELSREELAAVGGVAVSEYLTTASRPALYDASGRALYGYGDSEIVDESEAAKLRRISCVLSDQLLHWELGLRALLRGA